MEDKFHDLGVDAIVGADIMYSLGIHEQEIKNPLAFEKLKDVISYLKDIPIQERGYFMAEVLANKSSGKLDHLFNYVQVHKKYELRKMELDALKKELDFYKK